MNPGKSYSLLLCALLLPVIAVAGSPPPRLPGWSSYQSGDYAAAFAMFKAGAERGDRVAQYDLAMLYWRGEGVPRNRELALKWLQKAVDAQLSSAQFVLGQVYESGDGLPRDLQQATRLFEAAARQGHRDAQVSVATQYYLGRGAPQDYGRAARWYRAAAEQGDVGAQYLLASQYEHGLGLKKDWREAVRWYALAGQQGDQAGLLKARALAAEHGVR